MNGKIFLILNFMISKYIKTKKIPFLKYLEKGFYYLCK
ncbi:hypothetical protein Ornrh_1138 [Ornithobacterium rhinotracheale DSM 15997]|uniref:Uncharacterized protein n=1 Tax=Ornithobacterium rhinotracheale (strain ATCC 51463 / DSM 15997 / CCUG 23171 / CIP 104009 / LMG 9086) TaxID=867902 RepID=I4A039_ORNRL|nr:hypothetical protein Ornrh_1138 [Ornithobacterium rhinotracheale DSM 15997]